MAKTTTQSKAIVLPTRNISQSTSEENNDGIRKLPDWGEQYVAFPDTQKGQEYLSTFARRRAVSGGGDIIANVLVLLKDQKRKINSNANISGLASI